MQVAYRQLALTEQLLERQDQHAQSIRGYLRTNCTISGDLGFLLGALAPLASLSVTLGDQAAAAIGGLSRAGARAARASLDTYVEADRAAYEAFVSLAAELGESSAPFVDPRDSVGRLGNAADRAAGDYGLPSEWIFGKSAEIGRGTREIFDETVSTAGDRVSGWQSGAAGVAERSDPSSFLVAPDLGENFVQDLRWSAGLILGSLDWVAEQFLGFSVLEESVFKPFGGDWEAINKASCAWGHSGRALMELSSNISALPEQTEAWEGQAADAFRAAMAALSAAIVGVSYAFDFVSAQVGNVGTVSKLACTAIGALLGFISTNLLILAAEAAVPVIGWAAAAAHVVVIIGYVVSALKIIYALIDAILDAIADFIDSKEKLVHAIFIIEDIVEYSAKSVTGAITK